MIELKAQMRAKSSAICLFLIMIVAFSITPSTFSSSPQKVIQSTGMIGLPGMIARSGLPADIQATVNAVNNAGGGTVYVPAGTYHWNGQKVTIYGGVSVIGASYAGCLGHEDNWAPFTASTILHNDAQPTSSYHPSDMFYLDGTNGKPSRISGIQFEATPPLDTSAESTGEDASNAIDVRDGKNFRIDHCTFLNFCYRSVNVQFGTWWASGGPSAYGLVDHCVFDLPYKDTAPFYWMGGYGVFGYGNMASSTRVELGIRLYAGKYQSIPDVTIMYTEDCHFSRCRHAIDGYAGAVLVTRYCLFDNPASYYGSSMNIGDIDAHGGYEGTPTTAPCVCVEAYENTITGKANFATDAIRLRGGSGLFWSNHFHPPEPPASEASVQSLIHFDTDNQIPEYQVRETYIWGNDYSNCTFIRNTVGRVENVDYFLRAPTTAQDGWTYTPYLYPHPLVAG